MDRRLGQGEQMCHTSEPHRVPVSKVMERSRFAAQLLVHDRREVDIKDHIVVDGQPQHNAHQRELSVILKAVGVEPEGA